MINGAISDYTRVLELDSNNAEVYFFRGRSHKELKNNEEAILDFTKSIEINPKIVGLKNYNWTILIDLEKKYALH
ncbi:MAG: tetratricopeptide repeat protein [Tatlockia sp.]|nr:tetratricopeptide repeat protein [Tatlockia sp.]